MSEDTVTFEIADDVLPEKPAAAVPVNADKAPVVPGVRRSDAGGDDAPGVAELKRQLDEKIRALDAEKKAREAVESNSGKLISAHEEARRKAERAALEQSNAAVRAQAEVFTSQLSEIQNAKRAAEQQSKMLAAQLIAAQEAADYTRAAEITEQIGDARYRLGLLNDGETGIKREADSFKRKVDSYYDQQRSADEAYRAEQERIAKEPQQKPTITKADQIAQFIASVPPRAQEWLKAHPETLEDEIRNQELGIAHKKALRAGVSEGSDAYYDFIDTQMGYKHHDAKPASQIKRDAPVVSAPVGRDVAASNGNLNSRQVQLNAMERETARRLDMTEEQYAKNKLRMLDEKRLSGRA